MPGEGATAAARRDRDRMFGIHLSLVSQNCWTDDAPPLDIGTAVRYRSCCNITPGWPLPLKERLSTYQTLSSYLLSPFPFLILP